MPIEEQSFVDVQESLTRAGVGDPLRLDAAAVRFIEAAIEQLRGRVIVYFAPGEYRLLRSNRPYGAWQGDLGLGVDTTLWMDPDARIILENSRLVAMGGLTAPRSRIFDERGEGMVLLGGDLRELLPEWWGATGDPLHDDSEAIQRAIDAASARRMPQATKPAHRGKGLRPIPVTLRQMFSVSRSIVIGRAIEATSEDSILTSFGIANRVTTTLRGVATGTTEYVAGLRAMGWQTFEHGPDDGARQRAMGRALLRLDLAYGCLIENLTLDARGECDYALLLDSGIDEPASKQTHANTFRGCTFRGARKTQVQLGPPEVRAAQVTRPLTVSVDMMRARLNIPAEVVSAGAGDIPGFNFRNCVVKCGLTEGLTPSRGMQFRTGNGVALRIADTAFRGPATSYIDVTSGMILIEGCDFNNPHRAAEKPSAKSRPIASGFEAASGEDVYLGALGSLVDETPPQFGSGFVAMVSCTSSSATLFGTPDPSPQGVNNGRPTRSNLILGCRHDPTGTGSSVSVRWGRTAVGSVVRSARGRRLYGSDGTLCVVGSDLRGKMQVVSRAAQSVVLACRVGDLNRPEIIAPEPPATRSMTTVIFGLQCVAVLLALLGCIGCQREASTADAGRDTGAKAPEDASIPIDAGEVRPVDSGARVDGRSRPDVVITDPPDAGTMDVEITDARDFDGDSADISFVDIPRYIDPRWAMQDVIRRDIEITPLRDATFVEDFGPARQRRASCPSVTDGDESIAAPRLIFPMSPMRATSQRPTLFWSLPPGVDGARIELCRDRCCTQRITTLDATGSSARPPQALPAGVVFWRARGRVGTRVGRDTSFTWEFGVKHRDAPTDTAWGTIKDFNGDGFDDLIDAISSQTRFGQLRVYWGAADGLLGSRYHAASIDYDSDEGGVGDFNGDGLADAVVVSGTRYYTDSEGVRRYRAMARVYQGDNVSGQIHQTEFQTTVRPSTIADFNGDGYSDIACAQGGYRADTQTRTAAIRVVFGGPGGAGSGGQQILSDPQGERLLPGFGVLGNAGDLDGDGFAELLVGDPTYPSRGGSVYIYGGSSDGLRQTPISVLGADSPIHIGGVSAGFGGKLNGVGDIDGDRIGDVVIGNNYLRALGFYRGDRRTSLAFAVGVSPQQRDQVVSGSFGGSIDVAPDLDGDGRADPAVPCRGCGPEDQLDPDFGRGHMYVYRYSSSVLVDSSPVYDFQGGEEIWDRSRTFGASWAAGDYNGDGFDDLAIGDTESYHDRYYPRRGKVYLVIGGQGPMMLRVSVISGESPFEGQLVGIGGSLAIWAIRPCGFRRV